MSSKAAPAEAALPGAERIAQEGVLNVGGINDIGFEISQSQSMAPAGGGRRLRLKPILVRFIVLIHKTTSFLHSWVP